MEETVDGVPIPTALVERVADERSVDADALADLLAATYADLVDGADAIRTHYREEGHPAALDVGDGLATVLFVPADQWGSPVVSEYRGELRDAARAVHEAFARQRGASEEALAEFDALVVPSETLGRLVRAGLSRRQAEVQVLRGRGVTQAAIGDRLGMATNTVKVHCHRVDTKCEHARQLLALVEG
jgi:DNA-binding CsgD family transcriptional regulator